MKPEHQVIIDILTQHLEANPSERFGQALFNLNINQFADMNNPHFEKNQLRDIHSDSDVDILTRMSLLNKDTILTTYPEIKFKCNCKKGKGTAVVDCDGNCQW